MADFCWHCTAEVMGPEYAWRNDMKGLCEPDEVVQVLCEGCGYAMVDHRGVCTGHFRPLIKPDHFEPGGHSDEEGADERVEPEGIQEVAERPARRDRG